MAYCRFSTQTDRGPSQVYVWVSSENMPGRFRQKYIWNVWFLENDRHLEKINELNIPGLTKKSAMITDSAYARQTKVIADTSSANDLPSIEHYIKKILYLCPGHQWAL